MGGWNRGKGKCMAWLIAHVDYQHDDCLKWPFSRDSHGYGQLGHEGKAFKAHRKMCELKNGPPPSDDHEAAHTCNRGHQACINPNHLVWKTRSENQQDRTDSYNRGCPRYKLSEQDISDIRELFKTRSNASIARQYDVTPSLISKIKNGQLRREGRKRLFVRVPDDKVREIRSQIGTMSVRKLAEQHGLPPNQVTHILRGKSHGWVS